MEVPMSTHHGYRHDPEPEVESESWVAGFDFKAAIAVVLAVLLLIALGGLAVIAHRIHENPPNVPDMLTPNQNIQG
ncbi:MAG: hypothetical protein JWN90_672 [Parcubacteria group bacterium]|nr:hypothetical protein [Parcubacteria group bacterium]